LKQVLFFLVEELSGGRLGRVAILVVPDVVVVSEGWFVVLIATTLVDVLLVGVTLVRVPAK